MRRSQAGFSLVEVLIVSSLLAIASSGVMGMMRYLSLGISTGTTAVSATTLFGNVSRAASSPLNLLWTATNHPSTAFHYCVLGGATCDAAQSAQPLDLWAAPAANNLSQPPRHMAGTPANPMRYSIDGSPCTVPSPTCPLRVYATFQPICAGPSPCPKALRIDITVTVEQDPSVTMKNSLTQLRKRVSAPPIQVAVRDIASAGAQNCPAGTNFQGLDSYGSPVCVNPNAGSGTCNYPWVFSNVQMSNNQLSTQCAILPSGNSCAPGMAAVGYNLQTNQPMCAPVSALLATQADAGACPTGYVATGYDLKTNRPHCAALGIYVTGGPLGWANNPADPCTALENHDSAGFYRQHWVGQANCNPGDKVTGGGASCQGLFGGVTLTSKPAAGNTGWFADCCLYNNGTLPNPLPDQVYANCLKTN